MASGQVLSKSTKSQEHLEAGRRRLEEFRKKKGAKKSAATGQDRTSNSTVIEKQAAEHGPSSFDSVDAPNRSTAAVAADSDVPRYSEIKHGFAHDSGSESIQQLQNNFQSGDVSSPDLLQGIQKRVGSETDIDDDGKHEVATSLGRRGSVQDGSTNEFRSNFFDGHSNISSSVILPSSDVSTQNVAAKVLSEGHFSNLLHQHDDSESAQSINERQASNLELGHNQHGLVFKDYLSSNVHEKRPSDAVRSLLDFGTQRPSEPLSTNMNFNTSSPIGGTGVQSSAVAETYSKRSRPSFLDSLNIGRDSPASTQPFTEKEKVSTSMFPSSSIAASSLDQGLGMSTSLEPLPNSVYPNANNFANGFMGPNTVEKSMGSMLELRSQRQNEDFSALEQHIEDLTQEKFSLQRAMEASNALAVSLAAENSSLTESYNQQAGIASQLRAEMESLQKEIKARQVELEAVTAELTNAHLECNAADERAKLLASEVINIEEKALRLRSNELKLERELEKSNAEISSYKKKLSSLEKERRDLQQTLNALQEENKLLQSKLRKASTSEIAVDLTKGPAKKDTSTSTNDLSNNSEQPSSSIQMHYETDNLLSLLENRSVGVEDIAMDPMVIPPDQVQVIQNINSLISEIISEKEETMRALIDEYSTSAKLKDMNKELSHKLEVQTQRLELLTAQSMASDNPPFRQPTDSRIVQQSVAYADEGDEVVERVLGWIMKLFPGGPSKRRTSRL